MSGAKEVDLRLPSQPYFQPSPPAPSPFVIDQAYKDPTFPSDVKSSWGLSVQNSQEIIVFGKHMPFK